MALSAPLLSRKRVIQVKVDATKGATNTVPDTDILVFDLKIDPEDSFVERKGSGKVFGHTSPGVLQGTRAGSCSFKTELRSTGAAALDAGLVMLLQACGQKQATQVYTPTSVHATQETLTMAVYEDGLKKMLYGCSGTFTMAPEDGRIVLSFDFKGVWVAPTDVALPTVAYSAVLPVSWGHGSNAFLLATLGIKISTFEFNAGSNVVPRMSNGLIAYYMITDRDPTMTFDPESDLVAGYALHAAWLAGTEGAVSLALTDGTATFTLAATKFQYREVKEGDRDGIMIDNVTGQFNIVTMNTGDDEYSLTVT